MLADGCMVPACGVCYVMVENGKKIAQERGYYDPNKIRGGDRMPIVEKKSEGGNYLKREFVEARGVTSLKLESAGEDVSFENKDKKTGDMKTVYKHQCKVSYDGQKEDDPDLWTMNNTSFNACFELFGKNTDDWVGKTVEITVGGEGEMKHIKVDIVRSKKNLN